MISYFFLILRGLEDLKVVRNLRLQEDLKFVLGLLGS